MGEGLLPSQDQNSGAEPPALRTSAKGPLSKPLGGGGLQALWDSREFQACISRTHLPQQSGPTTELPVTSSPDCLHCWNPCLQLSCPPPHPALSFSQATHMEPLSSPSSTGPALSQGLRDFAPLNSLQCVSLTPTLRDAQLHSGLRGEVGGLRAAAGWPAPQVILIPGRGGHFLCLSASLLPSGSAGAWGGGGRGWDEVTSVQSANVSEQLQYGRPKGSDLVPAHVGLAEQ